MPIILWQMKLFLEGGLALFGDQGFGTFKVGIWDLVSLVWDLGMGICPFLNWDLGIVFVLNWDLGIVCFLSWDLGILVF